MDKELRTQKAAEKFERTARNMVDGPLNMFRYEDRDYGTIYVAVGRKRGEVEIADKNLKVKSRDSQPWTGLWFVMVGDSPFGQEIRALPAHWTEREIMSDVVQQAKDPMSRFKNGGAFTEGWWRGGQT